MEANNMPQSITQWLLLNAMFSQEEKQASSYLPNA
jgi:hypothetical protein